MGRGLRATGDGRRSSQLVALAILLAPLSARAESAFAPRSLDFSGSVVMGQAPDSRWDALPGARLSARGYLGQEGGTMAWAGVRGGWEPAVDLSNPEHGEVAQTVAAGVAGGAAWDLGARVTALVGARVEYLHLWHRGSSDGMRAGPLAGAALFLGRAFGHPLSLELEASYAAQSLGGADRAAVIGGTVSLTGVLLPDRVWP